MNREGYIRIHRSLLDWEWYGDEAVTVLFLHLLLTVNWKPGKFRGEDVPPGTVITSLDKLADTFGWRRGKLRRTLDKLKQTGEAATRTTNHYTAVTLINWAKYQNGEQQTGQQIDQPPANNRPTTGQPPATIEEGKKERREEIREGRKRPRTRSWSIDDFRRECRAIIDASPLRLPQSEHKPFFDYWTEGDGTGRMRFQAQTFFDVGRRMDTWAKRSTRAPKQEEQGLKMKEPKPWIG